MATARADDFGPIFDKRLGTLTFNSKEIITTLSKLAQENAHHASVVVRSIRDRISKAPADKRLPYMYLMDSILKNAGGIYIPLFEKSAVMLSKQTFKFGDAMTRKRLAHLFDTWKTTHLFKEEVLATIERSFHKYNERSIKEKKKGAVVINLTGECAREEMTKKRHLSMPPKMPAERAKRQKDGKIFTDFEQESLAKLRDLEREFKRRPDLRPIFDNVRQKIAQRHDLQTCIKILQDALKTPPVTLGGASSSGGDPDKHPSQDMKHNRMRISTYEYKPPVRGGATSSDVTSQNAVGVPQNSMGVPQNSMGVPQNATGVPLMGVGGSMMHPPATTTVHHSHTQTFIHPQQPQPFVHPHQPAPHHQQPPLTYPPALQKFKHDPLPTSANSPLVLALKALSAHVSASAVHHQQPPPQQAHHSHSSGGGGGGGGGRNSHSRYHVEGVHAPDTRAAVVNHSQPPPHNGSYRPAASHHSNSSSAQYTNNHNNFHPPGNFPQHSHRPSQGGQKSNLFFAPPSASASSAPPRSSFPQQQGRLSASSSNSSRRSSATGAASAASVSKGLVRMRGRMSAESRRLFQLIRDDHSEANADALRSIVGTLHPADVTPCNTCGFRVRGKDALKRHHDAHFKAREQKRKFQNHHMLASRRWFHKRADWDRNYDEDAEFERQMELDMKRHREALEKAGGSSSRKRKKCDADLVVADPDMKKCKVCFEPFKEVFSESLDQWVFEDAMRTQIDGEVVVVHEICHDSVLTKKPKTSALASPSSSAVSPPPTPSHRRRRSSETIDVRTPSASSKEASPSSASSKGSSASSMDPIKPEERRRTTRVDASGRQIVIDLS